MSQEMMKLQATWTTSDGLVHGSPPVLTFYISGSLHMAERSRRILAYTRLHDAISLSGCYDWVVGLDMPLLSFLYILVHGSFARAGTDRDCGDAWKGEGLDDSLTCVVYGRINSTLLTSFTHAYMLLP